MRERKARERKSQIDRQTDRQTEIDSQKAGEIDRQRERERHVVCVCVIVCVCMCLSKQGPVEEGHEACNHSLRTCMHIYM